VETTYAPTGAIETPSAPLQDPALLAAAGFLAGYSGTTKVGYTIDLRNYWQWCEAHELHVFDARRPHVELWVRSLEEAKSDTQQITIHGIPTEGWFTLTYRRATTAAIAHDATTAELQAALEDLSTIGAGNVTVTTGPAPGIWEATFTGALGGRPASTLIPAPVIRPPVADDGSFGPFMLSEQLNVTVDKLQAGKAAYARSTIGRRLSTVAMFYKWCADEELLGRNPATNVRRPRISQDSTTLGLDRDELGRFLVQAGLGAARDHALACLLGLNGLRVSEACGADIENLRFERGHRTVVVDRKGGKRAVIPLAPRTSRAVDLVVGERTSGPILLGRSGRLDRYEAYRIVRRIGRKAGIAHKIHPHCLRHAFITAALDAGVPLRDVQEAASHSDPRTTSRYDRHRVSLDRHAAYSVATFVAGATNGR